MLTITDSESRFPVSDPPRLVFVTLEIYPSTVGGVGILIKHTVEFLLSLGYKVTLLLDIQRHEFEQFLTKDVLIFPNGGNLEAYLVEDLCEGVEFPDHDIPHSELLRSAKIAIALERLAEEIKIDFVEFYDYCGPAYYFLAHDLPYSPTIAIRLHNTIELIARKIRSTLDEQRLAQFSAERMSLMGADLLLSPGDAYFRKEILPLYPEIEPGKVQQSKPIHRSIGEIGYSILSRDIAFFGRLSTFKGLDIFIKGAVLALRESGFRDWIGKFVIIGPEETVASTYSMDDIRGFIPAEYENYFEFTGRLTHEAALQRLGSAAMACFANRMESFCYAAHELHTAGLPLILSDTPAFRDHFVEGEQATFFDKTPGGLAQRMQEMAADDSLRMKLSKSGLDRSDSYLFDYYKEHTDASDTIEKGADTDSNELASYIAVFSDGCDESVDITLKALEEWDWDQSPLKVLIFTHSRNGSFKFASNNWQVMERDGRVIDAVTYPAPDIIWFLRAGDLPNRNWWERALRLFGKRQSLGALSGWRHHRGRYLMGYNSLQPEAPDTHTIGLRAAIRFNPRDTLQDAIRTRPHESEASLMLRLRSERKLLLTIPHAAVDSSHAIEFPTLNSNNVLIHDFDRFQPDYLAWTLIEKGGLGFQSSSGELCDTSNDKSLPNGFARVEAIEGTGELHWLRFFRKPGHVAVDWNSISFSGDWQDREDELGPVHGSRVTFNGGALMTAKAGDSMDFLAAPFSGQVKLSFADYSHVIDLRNPEIKTARVVLGVNAPILLESSSRDLEDFTSDLLPRSISAVNSAHDFVNDSLLFTHSTHDLNEDWMRYRLNLQSILWPDFAPKVSPEYIGEALRKALVERGINKIILSFQIEPNNRLEKILRLLPPELEIALLYNPARVSDEFDETWQSRLTRWYECLIPFSDRLSCIGSSRGALGFFEGLGVESSYITGLINRGVSETETRTSDSVVIAILEPDYPPYNIAHLLNAIVLVQQLGADVECVLLPHRFADSLFMFQDTSLNLRFEYYDDAEIAANRWREHKKIALGVYSAGESPSSLGAFLRNRWLPILGEVSAFAKAAPVIREALLEVFWEDSKFIANRLITTIDQFDDLSNAVESFIATASAQDAETVQSFLNTRSVQREK